MFCLFLWQLIQVFLWFRIIYYFASKGPLVLFLLIFHLLIGGYQRVSLVKLCRYRLFLYFPSVTTILPLKQFLFHQDVCFIKMCEASHRKGVQELNLSPIRILFRKNKSNRESSTWMQKLLWNTSFHKIFFFGFLYSWKQRPISHTCICAFTPYNTLSDTKIYNPH